MAERASNARLEQSYERFQQYEEGNVESINQKARNLKNVPKPGEWNVVIHVPKENETKILKKKTSQDNASNSRNGLKRKVTPRKHNQMLYERHNQKLSLPKKNSSIHIDPSLTQTMRKVLTSHFETLRYRALPVPPMIHCI
eukprot:746050-Hanusia_phi.AAC.5